MTRAPMILPISIAARPVPPEAPSTTSDSPGFSCGALAQRIKRRAIGHGEAGGAFEIERVGYFDQQTGRDRDGFARRAPAAIAHDAVARSNTGDARRRRCSTTPANSAAGRERKRRLVLVFAGDDQRVEEIQRRRLDSHHGLAGAGARLTMSASSRSSGGPKCLQRTAFMALLCPGLRAGIRAPKFITTK